MSMHILRMYGVCLTSFKGMQSSSTTALFSRGRCTSVHLSLHVKAFDDPVNFAKKIAVAMYA
jgi:hypothetical protein